MKKVLISCTYYLPNISGVTVYVDILANKLSENGHQVTILTSKYKKELSKFEKNKGIKVIRSEVALAINKGVLMPMFWWDAFKQVRKNDVIFANLPQVESGWLGLWSKIMSKKFIVIHHCEFNFTGTFTNKLISLLTYPIHFMTYLLADEIVSYTQDYANTSIFLKHFFKKIKYILPPVVVGKEDKNKQREIKEKIGLKNEKVIGFVGRIAWEKGLNFAIEAVAKLDKVKLVLVGPYKDLVGDDSFKKLKKLIDKHSDKVILYGPLEHKKLVNFYKICDCLLLPSTNNLETFGIVQAEAMISDCPVVASNLPGVRMPVKMTDLGEIARIGDSKDLAKKIKKVLKTKYSKKQFEKAREMFNIKKFTEEYEKLVIKNK